MIGPMIDSFWKVARLPGSYQSHRCLPHMTFGNQSCQCGPTIGLRQNSVQYLLLRINKEFIETQQMPEDT